MANSFPKKVIRLADIPDGISEKEWKREFFFRIAKDEFGNHVKCQYDHGIRFAAAGTGVPWETFIDCYMSDDYCKYDRTTTWSFWHDGKNPNGWNRGTTFKSYIQKPNPKDKYHPQEMLCEYSLDCVYWNMKYACYEYAKSYNLWEFLNPKGIVYEVFATDAEKAKISGAADAAVAQKNMNEHLLKLFEFETHQCPGEYIKEVTYPVKFGNKVHDRHSFCRLNDRQGTGKLGIFFYDIGNFKSKFVTYDNLTTEKIDEIWKEWLEAVRAEHQAIADAALRDLEKAKE